MSVASIARPESSTIAEPVPVPAAQMLAVRSKPQTLPLAALAAWSKPGLCSSSPDAGAARDTITRSFRVWDGAERGKFYLDPRLPDAELPILVYLDQADIMALQGGADVSGGTLTYDLPELAQRSFLRDCLAN